MMQPNGLSTPRYTFVNKPLTTINSATTASCSHPLFDLSSSGRVALWALRTSVQFIAQVNISPCDRLVAY